MSTILKTNRYHNPVLIFLTRTCRAQNVQEMVPLSHSLLLFQQDNVTLSYEASIFFELKYMRTGKSHQLWKQYSSDFHADILTKLRKRRVMGLSDRQIIPIWQLWLQYVLPAPPQCNLDYTHKLHLIHHQRTTQHWSQSQELISQHALSCHEKESDIARNFNRLPSQITSWHVMKFLPIITLTLRINLIQTCQKLTSLQS